MPCARKSIGHSCRKRTESHFPEEPVCVCVLTAHHAYNCGPLEGQEPSEWLRSLLAQRCNFCHYVTMRRTGNLVGKNGLESGSLTRALGKDQGAAAGAGRGSWGDSRGGWGGGPGMSLRGAKKRHQRRPLMPLKASPLRGHHGVLGG